MAKKTRSQPLQASSGSLSKQAYEQIRSAILRGELALGAPVSRRQIAGQLGMSLLPVAEALKQLEADGLVESRPRSGTVVRMPSRHEIRGHYTVREALESQSARLFAEKASATERAELQELAARLDALNADPKRDQDETFRLHERLHHRLAECTGCPALVQAIERSHILIQNWLYNSAAGYRKLPRRWHRELVAVLIQGDPEAADRKMREHVRYGLEDVLNRLEASNNLADARLRVLTRVPRKSKG